MAPTCSRLLVPAEGASARTKTCTTLTGLYLDIVHGLRQYKFIKKGQLRRRFVEEFWHRKESSATTKLAWNLHIVSTNSEALRRLRP
eukprot:243123-Rhodomonas_salina.1